jgi:hypothetical protein
MKLSILTYFFSQLSLVAFGQNSDTWTAFLSKDTLIGFKDKNGIVKIEPKFTTYFTTAINFDNIIAASEEISGNWKSYYLTKKGKVVGRDSVEINDNSPVCESEGFIIFRDSKTDKAGVFNRNGDIVIPAKYNYLSAVHNGILIGRIGAKKKYRNKYDEHPSWEGGKEVLLDTNNKVLIDNFKYNHNLNFYSLVISSQPNPDTIRQNFEATNGQYFSFIDFEKEFRAWLKSNILDNFTKYNLLKASYKEITYWGEQDEWIHERKESFIDKNFELIKAKLQELNSTKCEYHIFDEGLNQFIYNPKEFNDYFNNCGESKNWIYPVKNIVINHRKQNDLFQDHFHFLRTDDGYKLLSLSIGDEK